MSIWYPYTQHKTMTAPYHIEHADKCTLFLKDGTPLIDGVSSWWSTIHGYNHPVLNESIKAQVDKMSHVMLGGLTHSPAEELAKKLVEITPNGLNHVFFSDSGSVGMEVAIKMALQYWINLGKPKKRSFISLKRAYHGDTCGTISICDPEDGMHANFAGVLGKNLTVQAPSSGQAHQLNDTQLEIEMGELEEILAEHHSHTAAFVVEPLLQGAGGFNMYSPHYLDQAMALCRKYNVLVIFDEVATGFGKTAKLFAADWCQSSPDIMTLGKGLTAGYTGHAATLASDTIFNAFWDDNEQKAFMHGPTFMGNPLACAVALKSIELIQTTTFLQRIKHIETTFQESLLTIQHPKVKETRVMGNIGVIEVNDSKDLDGFTEFACKNGVWLRPFGRYLYTMPPTIIMDHELMLIMTTMKKWFNL